MQILHAVDCLDDIEARELASEYQTTHVALALERLINQKAFFDALFAVGFEWNFKNKEPDVTVPKWLENLSGDESKAFRFKVGDRDFKVVVEEVKRS